MTPPETAAEIRRLFFAEHWPMASTLFRIDPGLLSKNGPPAT